MEKLELVLDPHGAASHIDLFKGDILRSSFSILLGKLSLR